jgi:hypothetical protein
MKNLNLFVLGLGTFLFAHALPGCSDDGDDDTSAGKGGTAGTSTAGKGGKAGATSGGKAGKAGSSGRGGSAGKAGSSSGGSAGQGAGEGGAPEAGSPGTGGTGQSGDNAGGASGAGGGGDIDCGVPSLTGIPTMTVTNVDDDFPTHVPAGGAIASGTYAKTHQDVYTGGTRTTNTKEVLVLDSSGKTYQSASDGGIPGAGTYAIVDTTLTLIAGCGSTGQFGVKFEASGTTFKTYESDQKRISTWTKQ